MRPTEKPTGVKAEGVDIRTLVVDETTELVKHLMIIDVDQFTSFLHRYKNPVTGKARLEVVKRKHESSKGHHHFIRVASELNMEAYDRAYREKRDKEEHY